MLLDKTMDMMDETCKTDSDDILFANMFSTHLQVRVDN